jgi:L-asparaginase II
MQAAPGRLVAKAGAEGVYLLGFPGRKAGVAIKVLDGNARAWLPVIAFLVREFGLLGKDDLSRVERFAPGTLANAAGLRTGTVRVRS